MFELFYMGGPLFMGILTLLLLIIICIAVLAGVRMFNGKAVDPDSFRHRLNYLKSVGLFALVTGVLGQMIGLYDAFRAIEALGNVSAAMLAGGLKVSSICTIYGLLIYLFSYLLWFGLDALLKRITTQEA